MKTALITTTINVPHVLSLYRAYDPDVRFFVALDKKVAHGTVEFFDTLDNAIVLWADRQDVWKCSELIGWQTIQRRNIALLEALKWGADVILSIDDDNLPLNPLFYSQLTQALAVEHGPAVIPDRWFNVGELTIPYYLQRGIPHAPTHPYTVHSIVNQRVGVMQGICFGDPDCSARSRIEDHQPPVRATDELLRNGVLFLPQPQRWTVFNTQSTAMIRELAPAWFCPPALGRFDDIVASLITQRIMRELNLAVHFSQPFFYQQRNPHDLSVDFEQERWGTEHIEQLASDLDGLSWSGLQSVIAMLTDIWMALEYREWLPKRAVQAAFAFLDDVEPLL